MVQNSAQGNILEVLNDLAVASALREQLSKRLRCSRIAKFLAVANLCRDQLAASGILRAQASAFYFGQVLAEVSSFKNDAFRLSTLQQVSLWKLMNIDALRGGVAPYLFEFECLLAWRFLRRAVAMFSIKIREEARRKRFAREVAEAAYCVASHREDSKCSFGAPIINISLPGWQSQWQDF